MYYLFVNQNKMIDWLLNNKSVSVIYGMISAKSIIVDKNCNLCPTGAHKRPCLANLLIRSNSMMSCRECDIV